MRQKRSEYLNNGLLIEETRRSQESGIVTRELARAYLLLVKRIAMKPNFAGYSYRDEMESAAIADLVAATKSFDTARKGANGYVNAFAYFTTVATNAMLRVIRKEARQHDIRDKLRCSLGAKPSHKNQAYETDLRPSE